MIDIIYDINSNEYIEIIAADTTMQINQPQYKHATRWYGAPSYNSLDVEVTCEPNQYTSEWCRIHSLLDSSTLSDAFKVRDYKRDIIIHKNGAYVKMMGSYIINSSHSDDTNLYSLKLKCDNYEVITDMPLEMKSFFRDKRIDILIN